jgi:Cu2+-exporting ATPase
VVQNNDDMSADSAAIQAMTASAEEGNCYHCGLPIPSGSRYCVPIGDALRAMCCAGCEAVAKAIVNAGLTDYYEKRDRFPGSPREALPEAASDLTVFDREEIQKGFVTRPGEHEREAALILEGVTCPACIWLNETHLARLPGVTAVHINYTTRRARVRWDAERTRLSVILDAIRAIGYRAYPYDLRALEDSRRRERRSALLRLAVAGLGMMQVMMYAVPAYVAGEGDMSRDIESLMRWASFLLTVPVVLYSSAPFFRGALRDWRARRVGMDVPVALGIAIAFAASTVATVTGRGAVYFDSVAMFVFFLLGGRYLELRARQSAAEYMEYLSRAMPAVASRLVNFPLCMNTEVIAAAALSVGDQVLVRPGENFPADGRVEQGGTEVDESLLTGESRPVAKTEGSRVIGGSVNRGHPVAVKVERIGADSTLSGIVRLMERSTQERPRVQEIADRIAVRFVAFILVVAAATTIYWLLAEPARALPVAVAVLVVTCPCALSLATPTVLALATAAMARLGLIVTRGHAIETLARADCFVFDKTGTLCEGRLSVAEIRALGGRDRNQALALAAALEQASEHPAARAIMDAAGPQSLMAQDIRNVPGSGVEGVVNGRRARIGQRMFVWELSGAPPENDRDGSETTQVWLGDERGPIAVFHLSDRIRDDAREVITALGRAGRRVVLLSGDSEEAVQAAARAAGIEDFRALMTPEQKRAAVQALQAQGAVVAMIGDGVNDAPVLAQAQVSVAMGGGAALAQGAADMVLVSARLADLARGIAASKKALRIVRQNLVWAFAYNIVVLPLAVAGNVTPWMAAIGMSASSLLVVLNALRAQNSEG